MLLPIMDFGFLDCEVIEEDDVSLGSGVGWIREDLILKRIKVTILKTHTRSH